MELKEIRKKKIKEMKVKINSPIKPMEVTDNTFEEIKNKYTLFILDCWAEWCPPCKMIAPMIEKLAEDFKGKIAFGKLNVDNNSLVPQKYGIMSIPTLLVFKGGKLVDQIVGAMPYEILSSKVKGYL